MNDAKSALLLKAEAYQRRMQEAHERRLRDEVADAVGWLERKVEDVNTLASAVTRAAIDLPAAQDKAAG